MIRKTSIDTYHAIKNEGLLEGLLWITWEALYLHGPATQNETCRIIANPQIQDRSIMPRFAQLKKLGVIEEVGSRPCTVTGREVIVWDVTNNLPRKIGSKKQIKIWYGLFSQDSSVSHKIFKDRKAALEYKMKNKISGVLHEFEQVGR